jgi:hypothetical protein
LRVPVRADQPPGPSGLNRSERSRSTYRFGLRVLILAVEIRSDGREEKGGAHRRGARFPTRFASASSDSGDAGLLGACEGVDGVRRSTANPRMVVACFVCRWSARVRPKSASTAEIDLKFRRPGGVPLCVFAGEERGGGGGIYGGLGVG